MSGIFSPPAPPIDVGDLGTQEAPKLDLTPSGTFDSRGRKLYVRTCQCGVVDVVRKEYAQGLCRHCAHEKGWKL